MKYHSYFFQKLSIKSMLFIDSPQNNLFILCVLGLIKGKRDDKLGIRAASSCNIILDNVIVPSENMLGNEGDGFKIAMSGIG